MAHIEQITENVEVLRAAMNEGDRTKAIAALYLLRLSAEAAEQEIRNENGAPIPTSAR